MYCVNEIKRDSGSKNSHILHISPFICSFSFSLIEISVADFSAPIGASVFKFCVHFK